VKREMRYQWVLSKRGRRFYKGGNIKPMKKPMGKIFKTKAEAEQFIIKTLGSANFSLYNLKEVK
jgi:hypothetical protein